MHRVFRGDCQSYLWLLESDSIDALVTDPPAGISFMGKSWDDDKGGRDEWVKWLTSVMAEAMRVMKPGAHGLVWALPRTSHWTATALENAGFEIRDVVTHLFGTGFPKSLDVSKAIDKAAGAERPILGKMKAPASTNRVRTMGRPEHSGSGWNKEPDITGPATDDAKRWQGWGTALKPANEHWILVRKPLSEKTVAANVLKWGTGALNIDVSRVGADVISTHGNGDKLARMKTGSSAGTGEYREHTGRFPANLILDEDAAKALDEQSGVSKSPKSYVRNVGTTRDDSISYSCQIGEQAGTFSQNFGDSGGASRFFYVAKASKADKGADNTHPTVKSTALMRYLIKLIAPPNGIVLDPFMGSGSTGVAVAKESMRFIGIEQSPEYFAIAKRRLTP